MKLIHKSKLSFERWKLFFNHYQPQKLVANEKKDLFCSSIGNLFLDAHELF